MVLENTPNLPNATLRIFDSVRLLGQGGLASVFEVIDRATRARLALKILHPEAAESSIARARLRKEFEILNALSHPAIARVHEFLESTDAPPLFTLELIEGTSVEERMKVGPLPIPLVLAILEQVADAVGYLHTRGIVFRDLKPSNIMLRGDDTLHSCVLIDFGLADDGGRLSTQVPETGAMIGTSLYMAPEQIRAEPSTPSIDIYAFGVLAYELLAGKPPFESRDTFAITSSHLLAEVPDIRASRPDTPRGLARMIRVCLAKDPHERYQTMREVRERLHDIRKDSELGARGSSLLRLFRLS